MNYKTGLLIILSFLFNSVLFPQSTFFIKYKNYIPKQEIENKVQTQQFLPSGKTFSLSNLSPKVNYLAKGIAKQDEVLGRIIKVSYRKSVDESAFLALKNVDPDIEYVEASHTYTLEYTPNDSLLQQQWGLSKIKAFDAWNITQGSDSVVLAIIDTGIDYLHPDLHNKIKLNEGEIGTDINGHDKRTNGIDDDNNGFIDDYMGWDFTDRVGFPFDSSGGDYLNWDNNPNDENGHGTYIAGIAAAETNNITGIAGTAPNIKILNCRAFDPGGYGEEDDVAAAILYAVQMGVKVINMSFGDNSFSLVLRDVIQYAYSKNIVLVGSAGNSNSNAPHYPSGYSEVICVGNSTEEDYRASSSNYGSTLDLMAPGTNILTTSKDNGYASISGTSAASPFVSAAAALILSGNSFSNEEVKQILKSTSDDIGEPGWDIYTGAGRLNLYNALNIGAPSIIRFGHPTQDFSTYQDTLQITATVLSPYFVNYLLDYGYGLNPDSWISLIPDGRNQFADKLIYTLNISQLPDSVYTLRMLVTLNNGRTLEERVNFNIIRTAPQTQLVNIGPAYYGEKSTVLASVYTNQPCITRMYYRKLGSGGNFNFITLDAFNTNNQFVSYLHYGFIPKQLVEQNSLYEVYLQAENLVGLKTTIIDPTRQDSIFIIPTDYNADFAAEYEQPYSLPKGNIFDKPTNFLSNDSNEVLARSLYSSQDVYYSLYKLDNNNLVKEDSIKNKLPKDVGDFNNNGLVDLLSSDVGTGYIDEQINSTFSFQNKFTDSSGTFWPALAEDISGNGKTDVVAFDQRTDTSIYIWEFNNDFTLAGKTFLRNYTPVRFNGNLLGIPHAAITDLNNNGRKELWIIDQDGDIFSYEADGNGGYNKFIQDSTFFMSSAEYITAGDFNGDGTEEIAVLLHSITSFDIAPFYLLNIYKYSANSLNLIYQHSFVDASTEFGSGGTFREIDNSIRFADIDNDGVDELILFVFPYSYIFKNDPLNPDKPKIISYKENINSNSIFVGDLNKNNVPEVAFPTSNGINFVEFAVSNKASTPYNVTGYSIDSTTINLTWSGSGQTYYIYRGVSIDSLALIDSSGTSEYTDGNVLTNTYYYYAVQGFDIFKPDPLSNWSPKIKVYSHTPGKVVSVIGKSRKNVQVTFSQRVNNTIENLQSFQVVGIGYPNSVSPANQYSYMLSFSSVLPVGTNQLVTKDLKDYYGSPIAVNTSSFNIDSVYTGEEFFVTSFEIIDPYKVKIVFNKDVNESEAKYTDNYSFEPSNRVTSVQVDASDKKIIFLNLKGNKPIGSIGKEYRLRILNLTSSDGIHINTGAGSYLVLTGYAKDLSDVYVYPNPAKVASGKMTFANLPKRAKIIIWNLEGMRINELSETDGDGGVDFNMKDESGEEIGSGIYIYRIVRLDDSDNEVEEKVGKFAVIR
jgi:subtilisin family serine protease